MAKDTSPKWLNDFKLVVDTIGQGIDSYLKIKDGTPPVDPKLPPNGGVPFEEPPCPDGYILTQNGKCRKESKSGIFLWVGLGIVALTGGYFLVTKFKNK